MKLSRIHALELWCKSKIAKEKKIKFNQSEEARKINISPKRLNQVFKRIEEMLTNGKLPNGRNLELWVNYTWKSGEGYSRWNPPRGEKEDES